MSRPDVTVSRRVRAVVAQMRVAAHVAASEDPDVAAVGLARVRDLAGLALRLLGVDPDTARTDAAIDRIITDLHRGVCDRCPPSAVPPAPRAPTE